MSKMSDLHKFVPNGFHKEKDVLYYSQLFAGGDRMKQLLPYNILLVLALGIAGLSVYYNMAVREPFAITIAYTLPEPEVSQEDSGVQAGPVPLYSEENGEESWLYDDYYDTPSEEIVLATFPLEINQAGMDDLMYIPQVGSVMAQRIVQYRGLIGGYTDLEQLKNIQGIGDKTFETISAYLYIEGQWPDAEGENGETEP